MFITVPSPFLYLQQLCQKVRVLAEVHSAHADARTCDNKMPARHVFARLCGSPRLWQRGSAIRCELGRIKNESAAMNY